MDSPRPSRVIAPLISGLAAFAALAAVAGTPASALAQSFTLTGDPYVVEALSDDGRTAGGFESPGTGFVWTAAGGRNDFGTIVGFNRTRVFGLSGDGRYAVGGSALGGQGAYRWSQAGGYQNLGTLPGFTQAEARDANFDGSVVVGTLTTVVDGTPQAFRWTQAGGMQGLGGGTTAWAVSRDGNVIVGEAGTGPNGFVWTQAGGVQLLTGLSGGTGATLARACNFDGSIVVGRSGQFTAHTTMWTNGVPVELFSSVSGSALNPTGVNDNGSIVVGSFVGSAAGVAGVWTLATGAIHLSDYLIANGVTLPAGVALTSCTAVSADGLTFGGYASFGPGSLQGFVATVPTPCPADLDNDGDFANGGVRDRAVTIDDLLYFLAAFELGNIAADLDNGTGTGAHDGAVTIDDLVFFLAHFEAGC